ncbi:MAG: GNAT family N-acetyltransferase [Saprospiraceae bacterium]|nr:GNAT family N-acetyltransferase [Saprospiraceae bacterium]MCF8250611.1 GNAT family N-acetyltransferase [Saprospiraceae bacterium]MCF8281428.1 GNAT family N-acetyltransferase [Bacteroidales bacterium]MCF8313069.1 GNAT family N-acetyltransferase [Saprospiraceae bacterium]MCF8441566.1 GNAT family N-acetyltransferase [Saprospiraceae bacterium]
MESESKLSVREISSGDIDAIANYWLNADADYLRGMGAEKTKLPSREQWHQMLSAQLAEGYPEKQAYAIIWELNGQPIGHSNVNKIVFGEEAYLHLHLWHPAHRKGGHGLAFLKMTIPFFFKNMQLKRLYCEPFALNPAPNRTLPKLGFSFVKNYVTTPGSINFEQEVNLWVLEK